MVIAKSFRSALPAFALGAASAAAVATLALPARAQRAAAPTASIANFTFDPQMLTVKVGTTVTWTNKDDIPHGIAWTNNTFTRSKALDTNDNVSLTFTKPGTYQYFCYIHPHMVGTIVVQAAAGSNATR